MILSSRLYSNRYRKTLVSQRVEDHMQRDENKTEILFVSLTIFIHNWLLSTIWFSWVWLCCFFFFVLLFSVTNVVDVIAKKNQSAGLTSCTFTWWQSTKQLHNNWIVEQQHNNKKKVKKVYQKENILRKTKTTYKYTICKETVYRRFFLLHILLPPSHCVYHCSLFRSIA